MTSGIPWGYEPEQEFVPTELGGSVEFFASQVLGSPGTVEMLFPAQLMGEDRLLAQQGGYAVTQPAAMQHLSLLMCTESMAESMCGLQSMWRW